MDELILGPIVGGLSNTSVNLWGRASGSGTLHAWVGRRKDLGDARPVGESAPLLATDGFAGVAPVSNLTPETTYYYDIRLHNLPPPIQKGYPHFTTFPSPGTLRDFSFIFGSCFRPAIQDGGKIFYNLDVRRSSLEHSSAGKLRFGLFLGDQIYSDDFYF